MPRQPARGGRITKTEQRLIDYLGAGLAEMGVSDESQSRNGGTLEPLTAKKGAPSATDGSSGAERGSTARGHLLWFPARLGPWRKRKATHPVLGTVVETYRTLELPPGPNGTRGNPYTHAKWVREWRDEAKRQAESGGLPRMERVRISAVFCRRALNVADEDNDRARCKPLVDGLRDAGVIVKDTRKYVEWGDCAEQRAGPNGVGIMLRIEEV